MRTNGNRDFSEALKISATKYIKLSATKYIKFSNNSEIPKNMP